MMPNEKTILLVDDSPIIITRVKALLEDEGVTGTIRSAENYATALSQLAEGLPHLLILDINLPGKNGIELLKYARANYPSLTVIMLTNQSTDYNRTMCTRLGASHFIDKSTEFEQLPSIIASYC